jgi:hypothetical protein
MPDVGLSSGSLSRITSSRTEAAFTPDRSSEPALGEREENLLLLNRGNT